MTGYHQCHSISNNHATDWLLSISACQSVAMKKAYDTLMAKSLSHHNAALTWKRFPHYWPSVRPHISSLHKGHIMMLWCFLVRSCQVLSAWTSCWTSSWIIRSLIPHGAHMTLLQWLFYHESTKRLALQWRHNGCDGVSNHQPHDCLLNGLFRRRSRKTSKLRVTGRCAGNSPVTGEFPPKRPITRKMFPFDDVIMVLGTRHKFNDFKFWDNITHSMTV